MPKRDIVISRQLKKGGHKVVPKDQGKKTTPNNDNPTPIPNNGTIPSIVPPPFAIGASFSLNIQFAGFNDPDGLRGLAIIDSPSNLNATLDSIANFLIANPNINIQITGLTDTTATTVVLDGRGNILTDPTIGLQRANVVAGFLTSRRVPANRITTIQAAGAPGITVQFIPTIPTSGR